MLLATLTPSTLQRSRALSSAEMRQRRLRKATRITPFNGAALFRARRSDVRREKITRADILQRSRALSSAEMSWTVRNQERWAFPSTEPRSFERGDLGGRRWEFSGPRPFNGAALFRARRWSFFFSRVTLFTNPFNGAALFRARRFLDEIGFIPNFRPSTEPRSFERGDRRRLSDSQIKTPPFNGAALFRARRCIGCS